MKLILGLLASAGILLTIACGDDDDDDEGVTQPETATATETPTGAPQPTATPAECPVLPTPQPTQTPTGTPTPLPPEDERQITLFLFYPHLTPTDFELVAVERTIDYTPRVGTAALDLLIEGPTQQEIDQLDLTDPIPEGTELLSLNIVDGVATADFSEELLDFEGGSLNERTISAMITRTLKQFPTVLDVQILVEGQPSNLPPCEGGQQAETITLVIYFPQLTQTDFVLIPVERDIEHTPRVGTAALELLIQGPTAEEEANLGIFNPIPTGTRLLSLNIRDGVATADFSEELLDFGGGSLNVRTITAMIEETLKRFPTVDEVVILVEGQPDAMQP